MQKNLYAVIDVGSSMLTLKIAELSKNKPPKVIESVRGNLALGIDTYNERNITQKSINRCCEILSGFAQKLKEYQISLDECRCIATSAIREAKNKEYVLLQIRLRTGFVVEILDNAIERYYHNLAISEKLENFKQLIGAGAIILDIGAGSVQVSVYDQGKCVLSQNLLLGALRINELLEDLRERTRDYVSLLDEYVSSEINDFLVLAGTAINYPNMIVLAAGSAYLKRFVGIRKSRAIIEAEGLSQMFDYAMNTQPLQMSLQSGVPADLAQMMLPTVMIVKKYVEHNDLKRLFMPNTDIMDGLLTVEANRRFRYKPTYSHKK